MMNRDEILRTPVSVEEMKLHGIKAALEPSNDTRFVRSYTVKK